MKLDECLPRMPPPDLDWQPGLCRSDKKTLAYGLACARAGALAALDEATKRVENEMVDGKLGTDDYAYNAAIRHSLEAIRRLRDTIAKGESE